MAVRTVSEFLNSLVSVVSFLSTMTVLCSLFVRTVLLLCLYCCCCYAEFEIELFEMSDFSRSMAAQGAHFTTPSSVAKRVRRRRFPEDRPHICLAFLSCCGRTDLLNHTISAAIRHMEEDEPSFLRYEIAWVDNGSGREKTQPIEDAYEIDHALPMEENTGLAYGMNLLMRDLCTAPYILLLEEDWLYLDDLVAPQTRRRKHAIATAIALTETSPQSYDDRTVMGVFLRPETYNHFMSFPYLDVWETVEVNIQNLLPQTPSSDVVTADDDDDDDDGKECGANAEEREEQTINYQIVCSDPSTKSKYIWGSYTNGAGLYKREHLLNIGRMYGEPGDSFHDRYVESNYAYRVGLKHCHAAIQLGDCQDLAEPTCAAAFYHIGGGRGTRPMKATNTKCATDLWNFVGAPIFAKFEKLLGDNFDMCSKGELDELRDLKKQLQEAQDYRRDVEERNREVFEQEKAEREKMINNARIIKASDPASVRQQVEWMETYTDEQVREAADRMERMANSPHPLQGFWDGHGRPLV